MALFPASLRGALIPALVVCLAAGPGLPFWISAVLPEAGHVCACSLEEGHHCRCPKCSREAHEEFLKSMDDGVPRLVSHDCSEEHGAGILTPQPRFGLPVRLPDPDAPREALAGVPRAPPVPLSRLLPPPPHPPPIV